MKLLLDHSARVDMTVYGYGWSAEDWAWGKGDMPMVKILEDGIVEERARRERAWENLPGYPSFARRMAFRLTGRRWWIP